MQSTLIEYIKNTPEIAVPRAYLIACASEIEKESQSIVYKLIIEDRCPRIYQYLQKKQILGELNFKWKNNCFNKFITLFGNDFASNVHIAINREINDNLLSSSFETIKANRGAIAHENSSIDITINEIEESFQICMKAFELTNQYIDSLNISSGGE